MLSLYAGADLRGFFRAARSLRLTAGLLAYLAAAGALATLVPQGREAAYYLERYGRLLGALVNGLGYSHFFTSLLFLVPSFLFFVNLAACAVDRFRRELRRKERRRHGPDLLHLGLLLLVAGAVLSFTGRQEGFVRLAEGNAVELPDGRLLRLRGFEYLTYEDGRPRDWISRVDVERGGRAELEGYEIRVNHPLKLGRLAVYQASHARERKLLLRDPAGGEPSLGRGEEAEFGGTSVFYLADEEEGERVILRLAAPGQGPAVLHAAAGDAAGPFVVAAIREVEITGLQAVVDPGYPLVLAALLVVGLGAFLTFFRKIGDITR